MSVATIDLDALCSRHVRWRELLECGETWRRLASAGQSWANLPQQPQSWQGLAALAGTLLDPLIDRYGPLQITYGFAGPLLTRHIAARIAPSLDQHAGSELNRRGQPICARLGQACDFAVPGQPSGEVARWIVANLPFDRLYFYGDDRPLHLSYGPENARAAFAMLPGPGGRRVPRRWAAGNLPA
jgi:hypothetical protein